MKNYKIWQHVMLDATFQTRSKEGTFEFKFHTYNFSQFQSITNRRRKKILPFVLKTADEKLKLKGSYNAHFPQVDIILLGS